MVIQLWLIKRSNLPFSICTSQFGQKGQKQNRSNECSTSLENSFFSLISSVTMNILQKLIQIFSVTNWETHGKFYDVWAVHANKHGRSGDFLSHISIRIIYSQLCLTGISHEKSQSIKICVLVP